ncbi:MAG: lytic transglycosylase domain-containing protein [Bacillota bacterium]
MSLKMRASRLALSVLCLLLIVALFAGFFRLYPLRYFEEIRPAAARADLDLALVTALIREESRFRADAVSSQGAVGLMQLMPTTAHWVAGEMGLEEFETGELFEPGLNVKLGCWYLAHLIDIFAGEEIVALAAYNGGTGRVYGWLADETWDGSVENLEDIPTRETREFVRRVIASRRVYRLMSQVLRWE